MESELLTLLEAHRVGAEDATMAMHVATIVEHGYVAVLASDGTRLGDNADGATQPEQLLPAASENADTAVRRGGASPRPASPRGARPLSPRNAAASCASSGPSYREPLRKGHLSPYSLHRDDAPSAPPPPPPRAPGRYIVPTPLGHALLKGLHAADPTLVDPAARAALEEQVCHSGALQPGTRIRR